MMKSQPQIGMNRRLKIGMFVFISGFLSPLLIPFAKNLDIPAAWKIAVSGALAFGVPEIFAVVAVAIMGKEGFNVMKARIFKVLKTYGPADTVGRTRYRIGLVMFVLPLLFGWLAPYIPIVFPGYVLQNLKINLIGDAIFLSSFFILGGDFWDKLRALFIHEKTVTLTEPSSLTK